MPRAKYKKYKFVSSINLSSALMIHMPEIRSTRVLDRFVKMKHAFYYLIVPKAFAKTIRKKKDQ